MLDPARQTEPRHAPRHAPAAAVWDGSTLLSAFRRGVERLEANVDEINRSNVFPIPDGDTGSNMVATVRAALTEAERADRASAGPAAVAAALARGALMGARGNSGVVTSEFLGGFASALSGARKLTGRDLARALGAGSRRADAAVADPVEGTILTVIRDAAHAATTAAARDEDVEGALAAAGAAAWDSVARTPSLLRVLRDAGVVDAGGQAIAFLLDGALEADGTAPRRRRPSPRAGTPRRASSPAPVAAATSGAFGFETAFLVTAHGGGRLDLVTLRSEVEQLGESVVVAGDEHVSKVHVHTSRPEDVLDIGRRHGSVSAIVVEDLDAQTRSLHVDAAASGDHDRPALAVVAVAPGAGFRDAFASFGATTVPGEDGDPSVSDLLGAIEQAGAPEVILLPNGRSIVLAARRAAGLAAELRTPIRVHLVDTRTAAEGLAAAIELDPTRDAADNAGRMSAAASAVSTVRIAIAVTDAALDGIVIRSGDALALNGAGRVLASGPDADAVTVAALGRLGRAFELVTVFFGAGVERGEADDLGARVRAALPGTEVEVAPGGQTRERFLLSAE